MHPFRSKDAVINIWNLPNPPADPSRFASQPGAPLVIDYFSKPEQADLTSLHWNSDGSLLAIGSYDAVLRVCSTSGTLYFSNPQHSVSKAFFSISRTSHYSFFAIEKGPIFTTRFSKSGRWLLTASLDGTTCLWDVKAKRLHKQYRCHTSNYEPLVSYVRSDAQISLTDCCLDIDWLNDNTFATCGADQIINIMRVDVDDPIKTFTYVLNYLYSDFNNE
jgi:transducin (beta)-like 1